MTKEEGFLDYDPANPPEDYSTVDPDLEELLNQVDLDVKGWLPKPGEKIGGIVTDLSTATSEYGPYPLITVQVPSGKLVGIHCFHRVLRSEVEKKIADGRLNLGYRIAIAYKGEGEARGGNNAPNMYRMACKPPKE